jgi:hypothetical protein
MAAVGLLGGLLAVLMGWILVAPETTGVVYAGPSDVGEVREAPGGGSYAFLQTQGDDVPVGYDPCEPVRLVVNDRLAPVDGDAVLARAVAEVREASGLDLRVVGRTDDPPFADDDVQEGPDGWPPVQVSWTDADEVEDLGGRVAGLGGSTWLDEDGSRRYVTGEVALDAPDVTDGGRGGAVATAVLMHELAHVLGLDHVDDRGELMHPSSDRTAWGPGDQYALAALGDLSCG